MLNINLSKREKTIFGMTILVVSVYSFYLFGYEPIQDRANSIESEMNAAEKELKRNLKIINEGMTFDEKYSLLLEDFRQTESDEQVMSAFLSDIEAVASQVGMRISDKKPKKPRKHDLYNKFSISIALDGELEDIIHFVHILQNPPYLFDIDELSLGMKSIKRSSLRCRIMLSRTLIP